MNWKAPENCLFSWSSDIFCEISSVFFGAPKPLLFSLVCLSSLLTLMLWIMLQIMSTSRELRAKAEFIRFIYGLKLKNTQTHWRLSFQTAHILFQRRLKTSHRLRLFPQECFLLRCVEKKVRRWEWDALFERWWRKKCMRVLTVFPLEPSMMMISTDWWSKASSSQSCHQRKISKAKIFWQNIWKQLEISGIPKKFLRKTPKS